MMTASPTFLGFFNMQRAMSTSQVALNVISNNVANMNTEGYSRQHTNIQSEQPWSGFGSLNQLGQGSVVESVKRIREASLDDDYRSGNSTFGKETIMADALKTLEGYLKEPSENGINASMQQLFDAMHELGLNPESLPARSAFLAQATDTMTLFQEKIAYIQNQRRTLVGDPSVAGSVSSSQLNTTTTQANSILDSLADIGTQIRSVVDTGGQPNDLLDRRDLLLKNLSEIVDMQVNFTNESQYDLTIGGLTFIQAGAKQNYRLQTVANPGPTPTPDNRPALLQAVNLTTNATTTLNDTITSGKLKGYLTIGEPSTTGNVTLPDIITKLDSLFSTIATQLNTIQTTGRDLNGTLATANPLFNLTAGTGPATLRYSMNANLVNDPRLLAAADGTGAFAGTGDARNIKRMTDLWNTPQATLNNNRMDGYYNSVVASIGVDTKAHKDRAANTEQALAALENRRQEISGVNLDEEGADMLRFQRAFEAASRVLTTYDKLYETIINMVR
ncbi:MAG: flagellar hook-associated protein FlgK [Vampirovibrionales bacterium]